MIPKIRIALAQINTTVGDLSGNEQKIIDQLERANKLNADIIAFPELTITGYAPEDLLLKPQFIKDNIYCLHRIIQYTKNITAIVGFVDYKEKLYNAAAILHNKNLIHTYHKIHLPNYGVFDEKRYFESGSHVPLLEFNDIKFGVSICEDIWMPDSVTETQVYCEDANFIINISSSPYQKGKIEERKELMISRAKTNRAIICYLNLIGGQDEVVYDGSSLIINEKGEVLTEGNQFEEDLIVCDIDISNIDEIRKNDKLFAEYKSSHKAIKKIENIKISQTQKEKNKLPKLKIPQFNQIDQIYRALVLGTRDYILKNNFKSVVLGLSGGIDSALTAAIACDAIGPENVFCVGMPSMYSSEGSITDAKQLAENLGMKFQLISIETTYEAYKIMFSDIFKDLPEDITEENIQARIRGNIIMALSNKYGYLPLTTGNKSEVSVGYCTLYGDMAGGFAIIKDVPKTLVYELAEYINRDEEKIPKSIITKPPSAELKPDQLDEDSLPPYDILDPILELYIEKDYHYQQIVDSGFDEKTVKRIIHLVDSSEYKRRQSPPGVKITPKAFGRDRRIPITNRYQK